MTPVAGLRLRPDGSTVAPYVAGKIALVTVKLNGAPTLPLAVVGLLISEGDALVIARLLYVPVEVLLRLVSEGATSRPT